MIKRIRDNFFSSILNAIKKGMTNDVSFDEKKCGKENLRELRKEKQNNTC